jgi:hypothetical protein
MAATLRKIITSGGAAAVVGAAAAVPTAQCRAGAPQRTVLSPNKEDNVPVLDRWSGRPMHVSEPKDSAWMEVSVEGSAVHFTPEEVTSTLNEMLLLDLPQRGLGSRNADEDSDGSSVESFDVNSAEASRLIEAADFPSRAPDIIVRHEFGNVLQNLLSSEEVQRAICNQLKSDPAFSALVNNSPPGLYGSRPTSLLTAAGETNEREHTAEQAGQSFGDNLLAGILDSVAEALLRTGQGFRQAGNTIGGFFTRMGNRLRASWQRLEKVELDSGAWWREALTLMAGAVVVVMLAKRGVRR